MPTGSKLTPKGGLKKLLAAHEARVAALMAAGSTDTGHKTSPAKHPVAARKGAAQKAAKASAVHKAKSAKAPKAGKELRGGVGHQARGLACRRRGR